MAVGGRLPVMQAVRMAYRDVYRALRAMPHLVLVVCLVALTLGLLQVFVLKGLFKIPVLGELINLAFMAAQDLLLTPYLIAVHRFILLDEVTLRYALEPYAPRFARFFGWSVALSALAIAPSVIDDILALMGLGPVAAPIVVLGLLAVFAFIGLRICILFPAIAVDAAGATVANAFADTKGHAWRIFLIGLVTVLPLLLVVAIAVVLTMPSPGAMTTEADSEASPIVAIVTGVAFGIVGLPLFVAIASRIFQALAEQVLARDASGAPATG